MFLLPSRSIPFLLLNLFNYALLSSSYPTDIANVTDNDQQNCRCFPGDPCWPTTEQWAAFNHTLGGKLIATKPIASSCHTDNSFSTYNAQDCASLRERWGFTKTHYTSSSSVIVPFWANQSCDPYLPPDSPCVIGAYVQYSVRAQDVSDIQKTIQFVKERNIRLVIRNTGHDYLGKSTGAGAVAVWTHHLKNIDVLEYKSAIYTGKALKLGAGVQISEAMSAAHKENVVIVTGNGRSIGLAGGYTQGGGHGQLASKFGLAADQVLEWEVVTASGELVTATPSGEYSDLYWALTGGGGSAFGVVLSMTVRTYPEMRTATANLTFTSEGGSQGAFRMAVETFIGRIGTLLDAGGVSIWLVTGDSFSATPVVIPGGTKHELQTILDPVIVALNETNLTYSYYIDEFPSFYESYEAMNPAYNITEYIMGGRFIPRSVVDSKLDALAASFWSICDAGAVVSGISVDASRQSSFPANSVNPAWRDAAISVTLGLPFSYTDWDLNLNNQQRITHTLIPRLQELTPGGGAYLNEGDPHQPNWQQTFYGANYGKLLTIKKKYDPESIFYALTAVGSEIWVQRDDGRLCRSSKFI